MRPFLPLLLASAHLLRPLVHATDVQGRVRVEFDREPVVFDASRYVTASAQTVSVTRLDFLLSGIALRGEDGEWTGPDAWSAYLSPREGRDVFLLPGVPPGRYTAMRFDVGVPPGVNRADPAAHAPGHALNPGVNGLHWGWMGGYVFLALEGLWSEGGRGQDGYSLHVATDPLRMSVEMPVELTVSNRNLRVELSLDLRGVFGDLRLAADASTTHSRDGDPLAAALARRISRAFTVRGVVDAPPPVIAAGTRATALPPGATPYRFTFSSHFPQPALPLDNPLTEEGVRLGHDLFLEPMLSRSDSISCGSCHQPSAWFSDPRRFSPGADRALGTRQSMPLFNLAWKSSFFWDGRAPTLRAQVVQPIQNPIEMHETLENVEAKLAAHPDYPARFAQVFGSPGVTRERLALALEQFLLTLLSYDSRFDRSLRGEEELTAAEKRGFELFHTEFDPVRGQRGADCFHCHGGPLFQSQAFGNNGLDEASADAGRFVVTDREGDRGKFAVPSLRNIALTAPYMHDGRFSTLEEVVAHYDRGLRRSPTLDPNLAKHPPQGLGLSAEDQAALVAFLHSLTEVPREGDPSTGHAP